MEMGLTVIVYVVGVASGWAFKFVYDRRKNTRLGATAIGTGNKNTVMKDVKAGGHVAGGDVRIDK